jgi:hypothetical protein
MTSAQVPEKRVDAGKLVPTLCVGMPSSTLCCDSWHLLDL